MAKHTSEYDPESEVIETIKSEIHKVEQTLKKVDEFYRKDLKKLDRISDRIAEIGGSWAFIASFFIFLLVWVALNSFIFIQRPFDPYPYILLNLILSTLAAIQAPVILMSQGRAAKRDQTRVELDLEKDLRDLQIDQQSHEILLGLRKDTEKVKKKLRIL